MSEPLEKRKRAKFSQALERLGQAAAGKDCLTKLFMCGIASISSCSDVDVRFSKRQEERAQQLAAYSPKIVGERRFPRKKTGWVERHIILQVLIVFVQVQSV